MPNPSLWNNIKNYVYKHYGKDSGKMLVHAGLITWTTSSLAQVFAILVNDKIPPEQKKFLVPQELADGAINILSFYIFTNSLKSIASKLTTTGKWTNSKIKTFVENHPLGKNVKMGDIKTNLGKTFSDDPKFDDIYDNFKNGMEMIATTVGSVIACNVVTPVLRNKIGADRQKKSLAKMSVPASPVLQMHDRVTLDAYKTRTIAPSSGMKL